MTDAFIAEVASYSQLDSDRFGIRAARAQITSETLPLVLEYCDAERINLLIARCRTDDLPALQRAETEGFFLTDTLVYYAFDIARKQIPQAAAACTVRAFRSGDTDDIRQVATAAFKGYMGHYHTDPRLDPRKCDEAYASWAERSCVPGLAADAVLVAEWNGQIAGFGTLRANSPAEAEGLLFAVAPEHQRRGICGSLMIASLEWSRARGANRMIISTQITNVAMQKVWCRMGFEPMHSYYTLHRWFRR